MSLTVVHVHWKHVMMIFANEMSIRNVSAQQMAPDAMQIRGASSSAPSALRQPCLTMHEILLSDRRLTLLQLTAPAALEIPSAASSAPSVPAPEHSRPNESKVRYDPSDKRKLDFPPGTLPLTYGKVRALCLLLCSFCYRHTVMQHMHGHTNPAG